MRPALVLLCAAALVFTAGANASERRPTLAELEGEVVCPTCNTTLDQSEAPVADQVRRFIARRIAAGDSKSEIKRRLVAEYGPSVLAEPPKSGFGALAWIVPPAALLGALLAVALLVRHWSRDGPAREDGERPLDPELERRLDDELARFEEA